MLEKDIENLSVRNPRHNSSGLLAAFEEKNRMIQHKTAFARNFPQGR